MKFLFQFSPKSYQPLLNLSKWLGDFSKYMYLGKKTGDAILWSTIFTTSNELKKLDHVVAVGKTNIIYTSPKIPRLYISIYIFL